MKKRINNKKKTNQFQIMASIIYFQNTLQAEFNSMNDDYSHIIKQIVAENTL